MTSIRLPLPMEERLSKLVKATGQTKSFYIREVLETNIKDFEDIYLVSRTLEHIRSSEEWVYPFKAVEKLFQLCNL